MNYRAWSPSDGHNITWQTKQARKIQGNTSKHHNDRYLQQRNTYLLVSLIELPRPSLGLKGGLEFGTFDLDMGLIINTDFLSIYLKYMQAAGTGTLYIIVVHMYLISLDRY